MAKTIRSSGLQLPPSFLASTAASEMTMGAPPRTETRRVGRDLDYGTIKLKRGARVTGRIVTTTGAPVPGAHLYLRRFEDVHQSLVRMTTTVGTSAEDGAFTLTEHVAEPRLLIAVHDAGTDWAILTTPADRDRVFRRFERAVGDRNFPGLGIGLWIVREIVAAHGGHIDIRGDIGKGATFDVALPRSRQKDVKT